ncbi:MAG TPA: DUF2092 domain-containing protein, partial [Candidatus Competibacteraceae bacterium]|nr:DUF2092 domain-containing protein [Candidatus Competibacteraceae bacterium]
RYFRARLLLFMVVLSLAYPAFGAGKAAPPKIEPQAERILRQMSDFLKAQPRFSFHIDATFEALERGQKLQLSASTQVAVQRPDRLQVTVEGDTLQRQFWYDGASITVLDVANNNYATAPISGDLDTVLNRIQQRYGLDLPAADFVMSDPYKVLMEKVTSGFYAGLHQVQGVSCHHLAFSQPDIDWQIWIEDSDKPAPRKLVITYKQIRQMPQYTGLYSQWNFAPEFSANQFTFTPPANAEKIEFLPKPGAVAKKSAK